MGQNTQERKSQKTTYQVQILSKAAVQASCQPLNHVQGRLQPAWVKLKKRKVSPSSHPRGKRLWNLSSDSLIACENFKKGCGEESMFFRGTQQNPETPQGDIHDVRDAMESHSANRETGNGTPAQGKCQSMETGGRGF